MKKVNTEELTKKLNEFRMNSLNKTFTSRELQDEINRLGFTRTIASAIMQKNFPYEKMGGSTRLYSVPKEPIHKSLIESFYKSARVKRNDYNRNKNNSSDSTVISEQQAWDKLVEVGIIRTKFNLNTLKSKYPKVYLDCLEYEINPK